MHVCVKERESESEQQVRQRHVKFCAMLLGSKDNVFNLYDKLCESLCDVFVNLVNAHDNFVLARAI